MAGKYEGRPIVYLPASLKEQIAVETELRERIAREIPEFSQVKVKYVPTRQALGVQGQVNHKRVGILAVARASYSRKGWLGLAIRMLRQAAANRGVET